MACRSNGPVAVGAQTSPSIDKATPQCDLSQIYGAIPGPKGDFNGFVQNAKLREKSEILDMADWIYRARWATRQNRIDECTEIGSLDASVVQEWHHALNWLIKYGDEDDWDNVEVSEILCVKGRVKKISLSHS